MLYLDGTFEEMMLSQYSNSFIRQHHDFILSSDLPVHNHTAGLDRKPVQKQAPARGKSVARPAGAASRASSKPAEVVLQEKGRSADKLSSRADGVVTEPWGFAQGLQDMAERHQKVSQQTGCMQGCATE